MGARLAAVGWIGGKKAPVLGEGATSAGSSNSHFTSSVKVGSFSFGSKRINGDESTRCSSSRAGSLLSARDRVCIWTCECDNVVACVPSDGECEAEEDVEDEGIVDQLRSSSVDGGKGGVGSEGLGRQASSNANGEMESAVSKGSSGPDHAAVNGVTRGKPLPSPPSRTDVDVTPGVVYDLEKTQQGQVSSLLRLVRLHREGRTVERHQARTRIVYSASRTEAMTNSGITPFPILTVSQPSRPEGQTGATAETPTCYVSASSVATSPIRRTSGLPHLINAPNGSTSLTAHAHYHPHPSPTRPVHALPPLGPPPASQSRLTRLQCIYPSGSTDLDRRRIKDHKDKGRGC
ncbi:hypothetical protein JVU11DRAFT_2325 [Chiua virens]|nr:hypothetical protein JVU11DRAFT_2325 [Chiua virens]